jgi:hypothetical protein
MRKNSNRTKSRAIPRLQRLLEIPYADCLTPALLRLQPQWDPLRDDLSFQKLCEEKTVNPTRTIGVGDCLAGRHTGSP